MNKLQYDSFYKFTVSIGTLLITTPVLGIYYLFTGTYDILISEQEYLELSKISLESLRSREILMNVLYTTLPYLFFGLIAIGFFCVIWGGIKWYNIQKTLDESIQLDVDEKRYNFKKLTASEIAEKAIKETIEIQDVNDTSNLSNQNQRIIKAMQIENACYSYFNKKLLKHYKVQQNVRIGMNEFDLVAFSKNTNIDLIYEIKYFNSPNYALSAIEQTMHRFKKAGESYKSNTNREPFLTLVIVFKENHFDDKAKKRIEERSFSGISVIYISEDELRAS